MKYLLTLFASLFITHSFAQSRDLFSLAQGDFLGMNALFDEKSDIFGYISLYSYGKSGEKTKKFEYVVMDKNLNPFANNTFDGDITAADYSGYISFNGKIVLRPTRIDATLLPKEKLYTPSAMEIDLKTNTIRRKVFYEFDHGTFKEMLQHDTWTQNRKEVKEEKRKNGFIYDASVSEIKEGGYLVRDYDYYQQEEYYKNCRVMRYDTAKKQMWSYEYGKNNTEKDWENLTLLDKNEQYIFALLRHFTQSVDSSRFYLVVLDMKTGKELHKKLINAPSKVLIWINSFYTYGYGTLYNSKIFDDKIVMLGRTGKPLDRFTGFCRLLIDKKTFEVDYKTITYDDDFSPYIPDINKHGRVESNYILDPRDIFFMKDGSISILFEKYKPSDGYSRQKTTDMVYAYTDKDFKVQGARLLEKQKSHWQNSDYLFSQYLNDGKDVVFFYRDLQKDAVTREKNWNLFINTLIDGKFNQQVIPISSPKNYIIFPYVAKQGYIMLQEYNKEARYNQVRLERLNY